jgi:putative DNA primase/helicase
MKDLKWDSHAIHATLGPDGWRNVLLSAGLSERQLSKKNGPCPVCTGNDRYHFSNKYGRGDAYCRQCGHLDGFKLLTGALGIDFAEARRRVMSIAGISDTEHEPITPRSPVADDPEQPARPTQRVRALIRESCAVEDCEPAVLYLDSRALWPLPQGHGLRAHPSVEYWQEGKRIGRYPALIAAVRDMCGELVTVHVTYLTPAGEKLSNYEPRKILSAMTAREGCAVPLMPHGDTLGIAEGIETALSAARMHEQPVWAALNTSLLMKWEPPHTVSKVVIFADRDVAGLDAATKLMERLQERVRLVIKTPQSKDWNDALRSAA